MAVAGTYRHHVGMLAGEGPFFGSGFGLPLVVVDHVDVSSALVHQTQTSSSPTSLGSPPALPPSQQDTSTPSSVNASSKKTSRPMDLLRWFTTYV